LLTLLLPLLLPRVLTLLLTLRLYFALQQPHLQRGLLLLDQRPECLWPERLKERTKRNVFS
jgi:hypothetical protein